MVNGYDCLIVTWHPFYHYIWFSNFYLNCNHLGIASDGLKGRVFEVSLADLQNDEVAFRKFKLITEDVQGKNCLTNFHGMDLTRDKMCSMVKKWQVIVPCDGSASIFTVDNWTFDSSIK